MEITAAFTPHILLKEILRSSRAFDFVYIASPKFSLSQLQDILEQNDGRSFFVDCVTSGFRPS